MQLGGVCGMGVRLAKIQSWHNLIVPMHSGPATVAGCIAVRCVRQVPKRFQTGFGWKEWSCLTPWLQTAATMDLACTADCSPAVFLSGGHHVTRGSSCLGAENRVT
jgi:hypothetical protein